MMNASGQNVAETKYTAEGNADRLIQARFFPSSRPGCFIDIGAAGPDFLSMIASYRDLGWDVISVEPNPEFCRMWIERVIEVLQYACGDRDENDVDSSVVDSQGQAYPGGEISFESFSSLGIKDAYKALKDGIVEKKIKVQLRTLNTILDTHRPTLQQIDILSVDTEGWELEVLRGLDFEKYKPKVMIVENLLSSEDYRTEIKSRGYTLWKVIFPNDIYVRADLLAFVERSLVLPARGLVRTLKRALGARG